jgi:hypothetical protein
MLLTQDPVTLYKDGKSRQIPAIDAPGWIAGGWSTDANAYLDSLLASPGSIPSASPETSAKRKKPVAVENDDGNTLPES